MASSGSTATLNPSLSGSTTPSKTGTSASSASPPIASTTPSLPSGPGISAEKSTSNRGGTGLGRALLLEHLPDIKYRHSVQGVLFMIFANGEAFFYPLNDQTKGTTSPTTAKLLTNESSSGGKKFGRGRDRLFNHFWFGYE